MSWEETREMQQPAWLETLISSRMSDLVEGFQVRRSLPSARRRMVGPFIFLDQMGPAELQPSKGLAIKPHPHIGLSTVTYLFEGEVLHRDSLGTVQPIRPGEVNWMTAGRGIAHSERTPPEVQATGGKMFGVQAWVALPKEHEEAEPSFAHHAADTLPFLEGEGARVRLIAGSLYGKRSPVKTHSPLFYADVVLEKGSRLQLSAEYAERGLYLVEGAVEIDGTPFSPGELLAFRPGSEILVKAFAPSRLLLLGGEPLSERRYIFWNFVSSSKERLEVAKADWKEGRFAPVPQETEFIPLPEDPLRPVRYP